ncbi:DsbA family protein [Anaerospora hongkongensis]|uniref:DsbA family protein n=1 Tax=Anaerospora hongkongensis TaxID=244830 RepID=UPI002896B09F|nr:DsbA family protein [Anaerospora hongkongensis]
MNTKIYYVMDTMCGWCYGFSDVISQIHDKYKKHLDFAVLPAGMWTGKNVHNMNASLGEMMKSHNVTITRLTGKAFSDEFEEKVLRSNHYILDSFPGANAVMVMQTLNKDQLFEYIKQIYHAFYIQGQNMNDWQLYANLATKFNISEDIFEREYFSEVQMQNVKDGFTLAYKLGVTTYPSVVALLEGKPQLISQGYKQFSEIDTAIAKYI